MSTKIASTKTESTKIGHFEILSELAKSATGAVYKANDPQTSQTVALKAINLAAFGECGEELKKCLLAEAESTKALSHPNLPPVYGAGEIDGQFIAAMEYIQGNSIATMLARKEGFSIWDLLDIGRQVCSGLDHARSHNIFHYSLEPAKIMCGWDGTVRVLGYGVSCAGKFAGQIFPILPTVPYMSPEQVSGDEIDARSNVFSLGAILYEMVTDRKAFEGENAGSLCQSIRQSTPTPPLQLNAKLHPGLDALIMKALAKDPAERYQTAKALLEDLELCKESKLQTKHSPVPAKSAVPPIPDAVKAATQAKFTGVPTVAAAAASPTNSAIAPPAVVANPENKIPVAPPAPLRAASAAARAAVQDSPSIGNYTKVQSTPAMGVPAKAVGVCAPGIGTATASAMRTPAVDAPPEHAPKIAVDPMMSEGGASNGGGISFSEMTELPPLKEIYTPPAPITPKQPPVSSGFTVREPREKPQIDAREAAEKAIQEIKNVPPRLMIYSIAGAAVVILAIAVGLVLHVNSLNNDGDSPRPSDESAAQPAPSRPVIPVQPQVVPQTQPDVAQELPSEPEHEVEPVPARPAIASSRGKNVKKKFVAASAPVAIPGQMAIDSTPQGAQIQIDGKSDPSWITPFTLPGLSAGSHSVTVSKAGYLSDTRTVDVNAGGKSFVVTHLTQLIATLSVSSTPAGANVYVDGKDTGKLTPAQIAVDKGQHVVLVRKQGFLDETNNAQFALGQTTTISSTLRSLGNVDDIKTVGKMKKMFGGKEAQGMSTVSIKTQPKGAQVAINQHMLDKNSPVEVQLDPGNYIVDITLTGFAPIHKVIIIDKGGKAVIDEVMQHD